LWRINNVEWKQGVSTKELKSETDILSAKKNGALTISSSDAVVNCPFVYWHGGSLKERTDKTLSDQMAYGGAQVLNTDVKKLQVTFEDLLLMVQQSII
jgi:hypothetical protein